MYLFSCLLACLFVWSPCFRRLQLCISNLPWWCPHLRSWSWRLVCNWHITAYAWDRLECNGEDKRGESWKKEKRQKASKALVERTPTSQCRFEAQQVQEPRLGPRLQFWHLPPHIISIVVFISIFRNFQPHTRQVAPGIGLWGTASTRGSGLAPPSGTPRDRRRSQPGRRRDDDHLVPPKQRERKDSQWFTCGLKMI